jgi:hypothetical protein
MKILENQEEAAMLKCLVFANIISADNDKYTEEVKQEVLKRHKELSAGKDSLSPDMDWEYILEPIGENKDKYVELFKAE